MTPADRQAYADAADAAIDHPIVVAEIDRLLDNLGWPKGSIVEMGLAKLAATAAQVARAHALDVDPDGLRMSIDEQRELLRSLSHDATDT